MIKIENTEVFGWETAIRGMRNPMNSWDKSDSVWKDRYDHIADETKCDYFIGKNDFALMKRLVKSGSDHSKFMRMINVTMDITAPMYWWKEYDTYKVGTVRNSCSTMHKIAEKEFTLDDFSCERLFYWDISHDVTAPPTIPMNLLQDIIYFLNKARELYLKETDDDLKKGYWWQMIQLLPSSYNQRSTMQMNYQVLRSIYHARKNHKLDEWRKFCNWIETLPYSELITDKGESYE